MLLAVVAIAAVGVYISMRLNDDIRRHVESTLAEHYNPLGIEVAVKGARRINGEGIRITGITLSDPSLDPAYAELVRVEELFLVTDADLINLVQGKATAREMIVRRPTILTTVDPQNQWSASKLLPLPKFGDKPVPVRVEHANVEVHETQVADRAPWKLRDISFRLTKQLIKPNVQQAGGGQAQPTEIDRRYVQGQLVCEHLGGIEFEGTYDVKSGQWQLKGGANHVRLSRELIDSLPQHVAAKVQSLAHVRGNLQISFDATRDETTKLGARFNVHADLKDGQLTDPRLPYALGDLQVGVVANNDGVQIEHCTARHGRTTLELDGKIYGLTLQSPAELTAKFRNLMLDQKIAVPGTPLEKLWRDFQPHGSVDIDARFVFNGQQWTPDVQLKCRDVAFRFHKFPYPLQRGSGKLHMKGKNLTMQLVAHTGAEPVHIRGKLQDIGPQAIGWVELKSKRQPVDDKLLAALPPDGAEMIQRLRGAGHFGFTAKLWRNQPLERFHHEYKIDLQNCSVRFDRFPYPLRNVTGKIDVVDGHWTFYDLESADSRRYVSGGGNKQRPQDGGELLLNFVATNVTLDDQLRSALEPSLQNLWDQLDPRGTLDKIKVDVRHLPGRSSADLIVRLEKDVRGGLRRVSGTRLKTESISIRPEFFPYKFEKLGGVATYVSQQRRVKFESLRAEHKATKLSSGGYVDLNENGGWTFRMLNASVDRLVLDHDLKLALPDALRTALADLNPTGPMNLRGNFQMSQSQPNAPLGADWDVKLNALRTNMTCGDLLIEDVSGAAHFRGRSLAEKFQSRVELAFDAATYQDFQFTNIRGPLWIDNDQILIGSIVPKAAANDKPRNLTARTYGGSVAADGRVVFSRVPTWSVQASLANADLRRFANDKLPGKQKIEGKAYAEVRLAGTSQGLHTMNGDGKFRIRNGKMYDLPVLLSMLKLLRVREPSTTAFNRADIDFKVRGKHIYMNDIDFKGDAISLFGNGEMNLDGDVRMKLSAVLGREDFDLPLVRQLITNFNQQIMTIHVDGTIDNPKVTNEPFPVLNRAIEQIQGDPAPTPANASWSRRTQEYLRRTVPWPN